MPGLDLLASFVSAARQAGFAGAARDLGHLSSAVAKNVVRLGDGEFLLKLAAAELGVIQIPHYIAEPALRAGALVEVLQAYRPAPTPLSLVYPSRRQLPPR